MEATRRMIRRRWEKHALVLNMHLAGVKQVEIAGILNT